MIFLVEAIEFDSMVEANKIYLGKELGSYVMLKSAHSKVFKVCFS